VQVGGQGRQAQLEQFDGLAEHLMSGGTNEYLLAKQRAGRHGQDRLDARNARDPRRGQARSPYRCRMSIMRIPGDDEIRALHERFAPTREAFDAVYTHCVIVCRIAESLAGEEDLALVRAGALLHDLGVYRVDGEYIRHGLLGHGMLRDLGFPETLCRFCSCHTGVGITAGDVRRQNLPIPVGDYVAETAEERLVMYADKFHSKKSPPVFLTAAAYLTSVRRFGEDKADAFTVMVRDYGEPELSILSTEYGHSITGH
jgi:uncharacterized protein